MERMHVRASNASKRASTKAFARKGKKKIVRLHEIHVDASEDEGKDSRSPGRAVLLETAKRLRVPLESLREGDVRVARKSFDARKGKARFAYVVDVNLRRSRAHVSKVGRVEPYRRCHEAVQLPNMLEDATLRRMRWNGKLINVPRVEDKTIVVGSGPAGLYASLMLVESGIPVILLERGAPVERRARDIGALFSRKKLHEESNLCYGEGGAGTWSDGKLTTRIGKNDVDVRLVLETLVHLGAPASILVDGKPHLGTDRLVKILQAFRAHLMSRGCDVRFGTRVEEVLVDHEEVKGVKLHDGTILRSKRVVLATGHSSRELYRRMERSGVALESKPFAAGFRIEHPQEHIDRIQYGEEWAKQVKRGKGPIPVADYKLATKVPLHGLEGGQEQDVRGVYSFCMCPGGQIVPTSVDPKHLCINGMSFSRRNSRWANSAVVVTVGAQDFGAAHAMSGLDFQEAIEAEAAVRGGGQLCAPVQRAEDFMSNVASPDRSLPTSSYRLGVRSSRLEDIYPDAITTALKQALLEFDKKMPGFLCNEALLHGVETRTSSPVRILRNEEDLQSTTVKGLYPCGEGAGYAGGIVSAAVDGLLVGRAIQKELGVKIS